MVKPIKFIELTAGINVLLRRTINRTEPDNNGADVCIITELVVQDSGKNKAAEHFTPCPM